MRRPAIPRPGAGKDVRAQVRRVGLFSPGWPPDEFPNGIVTLVQHLRPALEGLGCEAHVIAAEVQWDGDAHVHHAVADRHVLRRVIDKVTPRHLLSQSHLRAQGQGIADLVGSLARGPGLDVLEMEESFGWAGQVAAREDVPVVVRLHGPWFLNGAALQVKQDAATAWRIAAEGAAIRGAHGVLAGSRDVLERTRAYYQLELPEARIISYPMAAAPAELRWRRDRANRNRIFFAGRFDRHKGGDVIIRAFALLAQRRPDVELVFAGPDRGFEDNNGRLWPIDAFMDEYVPAADRRRIRWLGQCTRRQLQEQRLQAAVTVACSRYETFGLTVTEAMSQGCPVIATQVGAVPEIVQSGRNGLLCRSEDPLDLALKIQAILDHPQRAAQLGEQAAADCTARYDPRRIGQQSLEYYQHVRARWLNGQSGEEPILAPAVTQPVV